MTKIATWNVNSIKARLPRVTEWLREAQPDVVMLQETKCRTTTFPRVEIEELGYNLAICGQKTYNGVAILSKTPIEDVACGLPGDDKDDQARYVEAFTGGVRVASIYLPNGNPVASEKFPYKLGWLERLAASHRAASRQRGSSRAGRRLQRLSRPMRTSTTPPAGPTTRCAASSRARASDDCCTSA